MTLAAMKAFGVLVDAADVPRLAASFRAGIWPYWKFGPYFDLLDGFAAILIRRETR